MPFPPVNTTEIEKALSEIRINHMPLPEGIRWANEAAYKAWDKMNLIEKIAAVALVTGPNGCGPEGEINRLYLLMCQHGGRL